MYTRWRVRLGRGRLGTTGLDLEGDGQVLVRLEVGDERVRELDEGLVVALLVLPGRVEDVVGYAAADLGDLEAEDGELPGRRLGQLARVDGVDHRPREAQLDARSDSVRAADPAGVHQPRLST